jgi:ATP-dependent Clp protease ATP-binding subunit ClpA
MTTNLGADQLARRSIGFTEQDNSSDSLEVVNKHFTPEFRNRLDAIIQFKSLDASTIASVVDKFIMELETQLEEKGVSIEVDDEARAWLAEHGFEPAMGARPMARVIKEYIKKPLAEELLFGSLEGGGHVRISVKDDALDFAFEGKEEAVVH